MSRASPTSAMSQQPVPVLVFESGQQVSARSQQVLPSLQVWCWSPHSPAPSHLLLGHSLQPSYGTLVHVSKVLFNQSIKERIHSILTFKFEIESI